MCILGCGMQMQLPIPLYPPLTHHLYSSPTQNTYQIYKKKPKVTNLYELSVEEYTKKTVAHSFTFHSPSALIHNSSTNAEHVSHLEETQTYITRGRECWAAYHNTFLFLFFVSLVRSLGRSVEAPPRFKCLPLLLQVSPAPPNPSGGILN